MQNPKANYISTQPIIFYALRPPHPSIGDMDAQPQHPAAPAVGLTLQAATNPPNIKVAHHASKAVSESRQREAISAVKRRLFPSN